MIAPDHDRSFQCAISHHLVECQTRFVAFTVTEPANARRQPLERHLFPCQFQPAVKMRVFREEFHQFLVGLVDVLGVARKRHPAERTFAFAEKGANIRRHEAREVKRIRHTLVKSALADVIAIVKDDRPLLLHAQHRLDVFRHGFEREFNVFLGFTLAQLIGCCQAHPIGHIGERVMR